MIDYSNVPATPAKTYWYIRDAHGNIAALADENGNKVVNFKYDAWGNLTNTPESVTTANGELLRDACQFRYSVYRFDSETGLYYLKARYYSPLLMRFLTRDIRMSVNRYAYANNNPINYVDEDGEATRLDGETKVTSGAPPPPSSGYVPPQKGPRMGTMNGKRGWVDRDGNVWVPAPTGTPSAHGGGH